MDENDACEHLPPAPSFAEFYEAVNGREPFPWQSRLAAAVMSGAAWPDEVEEVGIPTGLGKTACLDIAIWWLASQAHLPPPERTAPTRIWWVVNRRLLVDSTFDHASHVRELLSGVVARPTSASAAPDALYSVATRLRSLAVDSRAEPLEVVRLRGGVAWRRPTDPSQPAVILSTIPMYGSRLLFRGYGSSRSMRPVDAALAGTDSLVLVDEAHLAGHLMRLFPALQECAPSRRVVPNDERSAPRVVALTATGNVDGRRFELDEADEAHPEIRKRLDAAKPTQIRVFDTPDPVRPLAEATISLLLEAGSPTTCLIFANAPRTARAVKDHLVDEKKNRLLKDKQGGLTADDILVLTGQTREREAQAARNRILQEMSADREDRARSRHLVVVATQTLEVGADIDAECLVTEACGVRALTQRLGRLNRLGRHENARAVYVHCPPRLTREWAGWPIYGTEPEQVLERLWAAADENDVVNLAPRVVADVLGAPCDDPRRAPEILPALLWEWVKTTTPPVGEAPVEPYFSGIARPELSVSVLWRAHVPASGERLWPRPREEEFVDVPIGAFREAVDDGEELVRLGADAVTAETAGPRALRPGDQVVLRMDRGLLDTDGWSPGSRRPVADISILRHGLPLDAEALQRLCDDPARGEDRLPLTTVRRLIAKVIGEVEGDDEVEDSQREEAAHELLELLREHPAPTLSTGDYRDAGLRGWAEFISELDHHSRLAVPRLEVARLSRSQDSRLSQVDELDEVSLGETATDLEIHGSEVGRRAGCIASALGIPPDLVTTVRRAGSFHDVGKVDRRFQRWLDPDGTASSAVAKSSMPRSQWAAARAASGWPIGGRHEELSARLVRDWLKRRNGESDNDAADLLVHLVVSHHGWGRPLVPPAQDASPDLITYELGGTEVSCPADLSEIDWTQPSRFKRLNDLYGPWGLALLEAILRQADHAVSAGARVRELEVR